MYELHLQNAHRHKETEKFQRTGEVMIGHLKPHSSEWSTRRLTHMNTSGEHANHWQCSTRPGQLLMSLEGTAITEEFFGFYSKYIILRGMKFVYTLTDLIPSSERHDYI
jgi:hypothetical protein